MNRKLLFFDIDGTLWDNESFIPESTVTAIRRARDNGHMAFINSGRSRGFIQSKELLGIGFDGIVSGCGTSFEYGGETVYYHRIENDYLARIIEILRSFSFRPILEGREFLYMDDEEFAHEPFGQKLKRELGDRLLSIREYWGRWEVSKLSCANLAGEHQACREALKDDFEFMVHSPEVVEMSPKGYDKGVGIRKVCEYFGADIADTIAFGDSTNDLAMLEAAGVSVVMGNGTREAKQAADLVTKELHEEGIFYACRKLGLI
ncbi:MAG: HAD family hydrolase [Lachnospiraceae bacterium]|nr:HAD family hydrolase [Lachnospiraceae bacterium]